MFKNFRVILRITPRDIKNFIKAAGRFIRNLLPALVFSSILLLNSSVEVFATSGGFVTDKNPIYDSKPSFTPVPSTIPGDLSIGQAYEIINKGISQVLADHGLSENSVEASFYDMMYQKLISDECHLSYNKGDTAPNEFSGTYCLYSSPGVWNEDYLQLFVLTLSSSWIYYDVNTFLDYARARLAAEYSASQFNDDDYVQKTPISIKSDTFKDFIQTTNYNKNAIKISFREELSKNPNVNSQSFVKLYTDGVSCVGTNMTDGVYLLRYVYRDRKYYFSPYQYYFHREINVSSGVGSGAVAVCFRIMV